ncbi:MAG: sigma-54-dependent Fis family transcriptional regulator [Planctomycetota bacterium]|nr:MAG: sigma-54-dependent Fis family transcriptional regulator [Planctomycetota bacterium]
MNGAANILVIDDEESMRDSCRQALSKGGNKVEVAEDGSKGLSIFEKESFDLVILDLKMPGLSGMEVLQKMKERDPEIVVIVITGYATVESAVEAMKLGAYDFIPKPFTPESLRLIVNRALQKRRLSLENILLRAELKDRFGETVVVGTSRSMQKVEELVRQVGPTDSTVLISGETGTGKELVARAIHAQSDRRDKPFVVVDCGGLVENLFESELFGHVKGSFTGATETKYGRFEAANGGTVFLDEIGNISTSIQAKLLRVLQEKEITRVGSSQVIKVDVRIIAATNKDLLECVKAETFREDLFYRLSVVPIVLPALRERREDIPVLANHFLKKYNKKREKSVKAISEEAMQVLTEYDWLGNVRELENVIERAVVLTKGGVIEAGDLWYYELSREEAPSSDSDEAKALADVEREHIERTFRKLDGRIGETAEALGINRKTLRLKLKKYGID